MSNIANDDLFLARRANTLYKVYASNIRKGSNGDQYLVQRGSDLHYVNMSDIYDRLQNTDTMMVWDTSAGNLCKVTGEDARNYLFPTYDVAYTVTAGSGGDGGAAGNVLSGTITVTSQGNASITVGAGGVGADGEDSLLGFYSLSGPHPLVTATGGAAGTGGADGADGSVEIRWPKQYGNISVVNGPSGYTISFDGTSRVARFTQPGDYILNLA